VIDVSNNAHNRGRYALRGNKNLFAGRISVRPVLTRESPVDRRYLLSGENIRAGHFPALRIGVPKEAKSPVEITVQLTMGTISHSNSAANNAYGRRRH
jgi:hypothetical protein